MNKIHIYIITFFSLFLIACNTSEIQEEIIKDNTLYKDLDSIKTNKTLKVLVEYNATSYFIYKGIPLGFEYELLKKYSDHIEVDLEVIPIKNMDSIFVDLNKGVADIIAANITITEERLTKTNFTLPILITQQVLVQRKPEGWRKLKKTHCGHMLK